MVRPEKGKPRGGGNKRGRIKRRIIALYRIVATATAGPLESALHARKIGIQAYPIRRIRNYGIHALPCNSGDYVKTIPQI